MLKKKEVKSQEDFWKEYEEKTGEKVLSRGLGKYISGWSEFDSKNLSDIWGLVIFTSGGFRFHHFPQYSWIDAFTRFAEKEPPKEKTIFIPQEKIISSKINKETKWYKKIFSSSMPQLVIIYANEDESEKRLLFEAEWTDNNIAANSL